MKNRRALLGTLVFGIFVTAAYFTSTVRAIASAPVKEDPKSNPLAILYNVYHQSGWSSEQASQIAQAALGMAQLPPDLEAPTDLPEGKVLEDPKSNPLAILYNVYHSSGWSSEEAAQHARAALGMQASSSDCVVRFVRMKYCYAGQQRILSVYINNACWADPDGNSQTDDGLMECVCACPASEHPWLSLTVTGSACPRLPPAGTCVTMKVSTSTTVIGCSAIDVECACFSETSPTVNCSAIECCCCPDDYTGCDECPSCTTCP